jgi:HPt (histidine-containing phosphotransfer) domain-containing protein
MDDYIAKPVRIEEVSAIVENWGTRAAAARNQSAAALASPAQNAPATQSQIPGIDVQRLHEFADGDLDTMRELVTLYCEQTTGQLEQMAKAASSGDAAELRRLAHSCAGASATCGMQGLAALLRDLEHRSTEGQVAGAADVVNTITKEFANGRRALEAYLEGIARQNLAIPCR